MMNFYGRIGLAALIAQASAYDPIAGYFPGTNVLDHGNIDLDQAAMETSIKVQNQDAYNEGQSIYTSGGNSKSIATLSLSTGTLSDIAKKTVFSGVGKGGAVVVATASEAYPAGSTEIRLKYAPGTCAEGSLVDQTVTDGCLTVSGDITDGTNVLSYTGSSNTADRTLRGFSTAAEAKLAGEVHVEYFNTYYGAYDYADQIVLAAFAGVATTGLTGGALDFTNIGFDGKEQIVKKCVAYMNVFMYAIHELESSVGKCAEGEMFNNESAVHAWDEGVAFYTGNLEGNAGEDKGNLVYAVADKRCQNFGTCGPEGTALSGSSKVNIDITALFNRGQDELNAGDCVAIEATKNEIADLMYIPLIQGTLKYAYLGENGGDEKAVAEGTAFAAAVLGRINAASQSAATTIYNSMRTEATITSSADVKAAFESVYDSLNLTCEQVGGFLQDDGTYYPGMEPCVTVCADKGRGKKHTFTDPSGLKMNCGLLSELESDLMDLLCKNGGDATCPSTCAGNCGCTDVATNTFQTTSSVMMTCGDLEAMRPNKRNKLCKREKNARTTCRSTCEGFCYPPVPIA